MAGLIIKAFSGIRPRIPESLLQEREATIAQNCDFAYGELRNTKAGFPLATLTNDPLSIYTDDGLTFFSWPTVVNAVRSPIAKDQFNRLYFTGDGPMRVTNRLAADANGGPPSSSYQVGVPRPSSAPTLEVNIPVISFDETDLTFTFHYESGGIKYQEQVVTPSALPEMKFQFTPPEFISGVKEYATFNDFPAKGVDGVVYKDKETTRYYEWAAAHYDEVVNPIVEFANKDAFDADSAVTGDVFKNLSNNTYHEVIKLSLSQGATSVEYKKLASYSEFTDKASFPADAKNALYKDLATGKYYIGRPAAYALTSKAEDETPDGAVPVLRVTGKSKADASTVFDIYSSNSTFYQATGYYWVDLQKDQDAPTYTATVNSGIQEADKETRAYVYTYVNTYNEEGPPSNPTVVTTSIQAGALVTVTKDNWGGYAPLKEIRIYRTPTGSTIADYFFVGSIPALADGPEFTFTDDVLAEQLNEPLSSLNYYAPDPGLIGLMVLPNGILCAWKDNELHFSEPYKPWAWPPAYVKPLENAVVGGIAHGAGAVITTRGRPYIVSGVSGDSMTTTKLNVDQAGVSQRSIAVVDGVVIYASNDGLVSVNGGTATLTPSQKFFTREVWRQRYSAGLDKMAFGVWDGRLIGFAPDDSFVPFMIRTDEADGTLTDLPDFAATCAFTSVLSDQLYFATGNRLYQFNGGAAQTAVWQSRELVLPRPVNFGAAQAIVEGDWTIEFWAYVRISDTAHEYQLTHTEAVGSGLTNFRLPDGFESDRYRFKISGSGRFREMRIAQTFRELSVL